MNDFVPDLSDLMPDTLEVQPAMLDDTGDLTPSGSVINLSCRIEGGPVRVIDSGGREVVSSYQVYIGDPMVLNQTGYLYTLPARFPNNRDLLTAIRVDIETDEDGPSHTVVYFP